MTCIEWFEHISATSRIVHRHTALRGRVPVVHLGTDCETRFFIGVRWFADRWEGDLMHPIGRHLAVRLIVSSYLGIMMILLGRSMLETFTVYPNIFHNLPDLFKAGLEFMTVRTPHDFYPPLGFCSWLLGGASLVAALIRELEAVANRECEEQTNLRRIS